MCERLVSPIFSQLITATQSPLKLGIMASGSGSNFAAIATAIAANLLPAQIQIVIYNNPGAKVAERAQQQGLSTKLINHRNYTSREAFDQEIVAALNAADIDWVIMVGWMRRATQVLVDAFPNRIVNIHPSLLPSFPGIHAIEQALEYGVKISGCTVHIVTLEVDRGPILAQAAVPVLPEDTAETLHARIQVQEHRIIVDAIAKLANDSVI
jgi:phosphoribosylglycinamide formyltransferase 1